MFLGEMFFLNKLEKRFQVTDRHLKLIIYRSVEKNGRQHLYSAIILFGYFQNLYVHVNFSIYYKLLYATKMGRLITFYMVSRPAFSIKIILWTIPLCLRFVTLYRK